MLIFLKLHRTLESVAELFNLYDLYLFEKVEYLKETTVSVIFNLVLPSITKLEHKEEITTISNALLHAAL